MWKKYKPEILFTLAALAFGIIGAIATGTGMASYEALAKPPLTPPPLVFPIVWTLLYILMGVGAGMVWRSGSDRRQGAIWVFFAQLAANAGWSILFFGLQMRFTALLWLMLLWGLAWWMTQLFAPLSKRAARLQIPYLLWLAFAAYLNFGVWFINKM